MRRTRTNIVLLVGALATWDAARGQDTQPPPDDIAAIVRRLSERIEALEHQHTADQKHIQSLEARLSQLEGGATSVASPPQPESAEAPAVAAAVPQSTGLFDFSGAALGTGNELNPVTTVFVDLGASISSRGRNKAINRFNFREAELDLRAAISPEADGVMIVTLGEEIESERNGDVSIDRDVDIEEGYINFHSLPHGLALKIGKFRNVFGRNNLLHTHDLPQVTRPLAVRNFLGGEGVITTGASLSWLVPNPWDEYLEATLEVVNSDGGSESPILGGPNADNPAVVGHMKFFRDLTETSSLELGGSYLFAHTTGDADFNANVFGVDVTYQWTDPNPALFRSLVVQSELFWSENDVDRGPLRSGRNSSFGAYAFGQYQLNRDWYVGLRADYSEFPNSDSRGTDDWDAALAPYVTWYINEFLRARLEYQQRFFEIRDRTSTEEAVFLQFTAVIGAHPPHPYWVHR